MTINWISTYYIQVLGGGTEGKRRLGRSMHRFEDDIKMNLTVMVWKGVDCICLDPGNLNMVINLSGGTRWCSWWRHYATSRKVEGSIHDGVIGIYH